MYNYDKMRPCVRNALEEGAKNIFQFEKMRFAIIYELKRLGFKKENIKQILFDWNQRCYKVLTTGEAKRQLCEYVDWFYKKECKLSCKGLTSYCIHKDGECEFKKANKKNEKLPFPLNATINKIEHKYQPHGYLMGKIIRILESARQERGGWDKVYIGMRTIKAKLLDIENIAIDIMTISRELYRMQEVGILKIEKGKPGTFGTRHANGYKFLKWSPDNP